MEQFENLVRFLSTYSYLLLVLAGLSSPIYLLIMHVPGPVRRG